MKKFITSIAFLIVSLQLGAQTTYTVSSNTNWNGNYPNNCNTCTFNITSGVTIQLNTNATCHNCTINGGALNMTQDFTFQQSAFNNTTVNVNGQTLNLQNNGTSFTNSTVNISGAGNFDPTGSISITGSIFNFSGTSEFHNNGGTLNISNSHLYFYGNSFFNVTAGPVNLSSNTQIVAGDGTSGSKAYLLFNGPTLNLVDAGSAVYAANYNNYYANWNSYKSLSNSKTYATASNNKNCGTAGKNACSAQFFYGCGSFGSSGPVTCTTLATSISDFKAFKSGDAIRLSWSLSEASPGSYFKVERSNDAVYFEPVTSMVAETDGTYTYIDLSAPAGENDYRISLINADGKISYSNIKTVQMNVSGEINIFPNPATGGRFFIQTTDTEPAAVSIYSMDGRILYLHTFAGQLKYSISLPVTQNRQLLVVRVVTKEKSSTFSLLSLP
jgi:hypothetical protein